jgi:hypothetical protein
MTSFHQPVMRPLPAVLHNRPQKIRTAAERAVVSALASGHAVALAYADRGSYGALDELCGRADQEPASKSRTCWCRAGTCCSVSGFISTLRRMRPLATSAATWCPRAVRLAPSTV